MPGPMLWRRGRRRRRRLWWALAVALGLLLAVRQVQAGLADVRGQAPGGPALPPAPVAEVAARLSPAAALAGAALRQALAGGALALERYTALLGFSARHGPQPPCRPPAS